MIDGRHDTLVEEEEEKRLDDCRCFLSSHHVSELNDRNNRLVELVVRRPPRQQETR